MDLHGASSSWPGDWVVGTTHELQADGCRAVELEHRGTQPPGLTLVGGGTPFFTALDSWVDLNLVETRTFPGGVVLTRYETRR